MKWLLFLLSFNLHAVEIVKHVFPDKIELKVVRVETDSFNTYLLTTDKLTELTMVCAGNVFYDKNKKAFLEFRNYYREVAGNFTFDNKACVELSKFIDTVQSGVTSDNGFTITLDRKAMSVKKIVYPKLDPFAVEELRINTEKWYNFRVRE